MSSNRSALASPNLGTDQFLRLAESPGEVPDFAYDVGSSLTSGKWRVSMDLLFGNLEAYHVYFRESGSAAVNVADIRFSSGGGLTVDSLGGTRFASYAAGFAYRLVAELDLDAELMDVFLNGVQITSDQAIDDVFGSATIGFEFTSTDPVPGGFDGMMQVYNFRVASVPAPSLPALVFIGLAGFLAARRREQG